MTSSQAARLITLIAILGFVSGCGTRSRPQNAKVDTSAAKADDNKDKGGPGTPGGDGGAGGGSGGGGTGGQSGPAVLGGEPSAWRCCVL